MGYVIRTTVVNTLDWIVIYMTTFRAVDVDILDWISTVLQVGVLTEDLPQGRSEK